MQSIESQYNSLANFLENISRQYHVNIHIGGLITEYPNKKIPIPQIMSIYSFHQNPYCLFVKGSQALWSRCICSKAAIVRALEQKEGPVFGVCHCGIAEYIVPIMCSGQVVGYLSVGYYRPDQSVLYKRLRKTAQNYGFSKEELFYQYNKHIPDRQYPDDELIAIMGVMSLAFSYLANELRLWNSEMTSTRIQHQLLMQKASEYLHVRYGRNITIEGLAKFCNCSQSLLQHLFKEHYGMTISAYLEALRMEKARILLKYSELSIGQIAAQIGYRDPNYFSTVFTKNHSISPSAYRQQEIQNN